MKPLTIEELKALPLGEWVWIVETENAYPNNYFHGEYCRKTPPYLDGFCYGWQGSGGFYKYADYGTKWLAYKNKEQAEAKGEIVELPKEKWAITRSAICVVGSFDYDIEERRPLAAWGDDRWHFGYEPTDKWRTIVEEFDTKEQAEAKLAELKGEK